nr:MAG TPA: hypothetical protein [Caudoviricetes sp.]
MYYSFFELQNHTKFCQEFFKKSSIFLIYF